MDRKKSFLNVGVSLAFKIINLILSVLVRRALIIHCGNELNGLTALYTSIIGFLSAAELGIGTAISFGMYRPIVENDRKKLAALFGLFRKLYRLVAAFILIAGLFITPFLPHLAKDYLQIGVDLYGSFILMLISAALSYLFGAETALISAYRNNYIATAITSGGLCLQNILQIVVLSQTGSFHSFLYCRIAAVLIQYAAAKTFTRKNYAPIVQAKEKPDAAMKTELKKNLRAMFMHKIGALLVNSLDGVIISAFIGVAALGKYSNYTTIMASVGNIISFGIISLASTWGQLYADKKEQTQRYAERAYLICAMAGILFHLGYYAVIDPLIALLYSEELIIGKEIRFVVTMGGFIQFLRQNTMTFRDATGTFYHDRKKPIIEGLINIVLSVVFVKHFGIIGATLATISTNLFICHIAEPYVLYKHAFQASPKKYYLQNYGFILLFGLLLLLFDRLMLSPDEPLAGLFLNGCLSVLVSAAVCGVIFACKRKMMIGGSENGS